jgi:hypothetical protein
MQSRFAVKIWRPETGETLDATATLSPLECDAERIRLFIDVPLPDGGGVVERMPYDHRRDNLFDGPVWISQADLDAINEAQLPGLLKTAEREHEGLKDAAEDAALEWAEAGQKLVQLRTLQGRIGLRKAGVHIEQDGSMSMEEPNA